MLQATRPRAPSSPASVRWTHATTRVEAWPAGCREVVARLAPGAEARRLLYAPHHRRADGYEPRELSPRFGNLLRQVGEAGSLGRAFSAALRASDDPTSDALGRTQAEAACGMDRVVRIRLSDPGRAERLAALLRSSGLAESSHPVVAQRLHDPAPDTDSLPFDRPGGWAFRLVRGDDALLFEPGRPDVLVAVLDTGVDHSHPEFAGKLVPGYDFVDMPADEPGLVGDVSVRDASAQDESGHGTHVAGVIGGLGRNMPQGLGGRCRILPVRVLGTMLEHGSRVGVGNCPDIDAGIKYAVDHGADVVNLSLGLAPVGPGIPHRRAVEYARLHNVVVVAASGNDGRPQLLFPGAVPGVITVGAVTELTQAAPFSTYGEGLDVMAPGTDVYSADLGGGYRYRSGTSHAAPFVSGVAALIVARGRRSGVRLGERTVRRIIRDTADRPDTRYADLRYGRGILNAEDAVVLTSNLIRSHLARRRAERWQDAEQPAQPASTAAK
jgi:thermitase